MLFSIKRGEPISSISVNLEHSNHHEVSNRAAADNFGDFSLRGVSDATTANKQARLLSAGTKAESRMKLCKFYLHKIAISKPKSQIYSITYFFIAAN